MSRPELTDRLRAHLQTAEDQLTQQSTQQKGDASPSASPLAAEPWSFSQPLLQAMPDTLQNPFFIYIKHREPLVFIGDKGQNVVLWLTTVKDYLEFMTCSECQAIAYVILLLSGNARIWWDSEFLSQRNKRPESIEEFKLLLRAQFESPIRETRTRTELLTLAQKKGENTVTCMARTKSLLHRVLGYDMKTALQQWILGLRQPYRLEAAKENPQTLAAAEHLVARLEEAYEFSRSGKDEGSSSKKGNNGDQGGKQKKRNFNVGQAGKQGNNSNQQWQKAGGPPATSHQ